MRVLFNTYSVAFDCPGGGEIQLLRGKQALEALGVDVRLFDLWRPRLDEIDLVHYYSVQGGSMNFCDYVKRRGLPLAISPVLWLTPENRGQLPLQEIHDLLHRCDRVLPNSRAEQKQLAAQFELANEKFTVVPNGVDPSFGEPADPEMFRERFKLTGPFLFNAANIEPRKNQRRLIQAARRTGIKLVLAGRVRDPEYFDACRQERGNHVQYVGFLEHDDPLLKSAYAACEAFVLPSLLETPGLAALEAAAQGARLVVTRVGSPPEYFGPLAGYVEPLDVEDIRRGIVLQLATPRTPHLRDHVLAHFTWAAAGRALAGAYRQTLEASVRHAA